MDADEWIFVLPDGREVVARIQDYCPYLSEDTAWIIRQFTREDSSENSETFHGVWADPGFSLVARATQSSVNYANFDSSELQALWDIAQKRPRAFLAALNSAVRE